MSDSLFDDESIPFFILTNRAGQYSLWPEPLPLPPDWTPVRGPIPRAQCMQWLSAHGSAHLAQTAPAPEERSTR